MTAAAASPALAAVGISKRYGSRQALRDVALEAAPGEVVAVIGPHGAGKTTLLSILAAIQPPTSGTVSRPPRDVGVPQQPAVYGKLSVAENLRPFARLERVADPAAAVAAMLEREDHAFARLVRGLVPRLALLGEKVALSAGCGLAAALAMLCGIGLCVHLDWSRFGLWVAAPAGGARALSALFPFRPALQAADAALNGAEPGLGTALAHLGVRAVAYVAVARAAIGRLA